MTLKTTALHDQVILSWFRVPWGLSVLSDLQSCETGPPAAKGKDATNGAPGIATNGASTLQLPNPRSARLGRMAPEAPHVTHQRRVDQGFSRIHGELPGKGSD